MKLHWEQLDDAWDGPKPDGFTYRAAVPGGWLVSIWAGDSERQEFGGGLTFLPDPERTWKPLLRQRE